MGFIGPPCIELLLLVIIRLGGSVVKLGYDVFSMFFVFYFGVGLSYIGTRLCCLPGRHVGYFLDDVLAAAAAKTVGIVAMVARGDVRGVSKEGVVPLPAQQEVGAAATDHVIIAAAAGQGVIAVAGGIRSRGVAREDIIARIAEDEVVTALARDRAVRMGHGFHWASLH